jgi:hypothetical protein
MKRQMTRHRSLRGETESQDEDKERKGRGEAHLSAA